LRLTTRANNELFAIKATAPASDWAIGEHLATTKFGTDPPLYETNRTPLALRWNGATWTAATIPQLSQAKLGAQLTQIAATDPNDVWITGTSSGTTLVSADSSIAADSDYLIHYNGSIWASISPPQVPGVNPNHDTATVNQASFPLIAPVGGDDLWVAGGLSASAQNPTGGAFHYYVMIYHYVAGQWRRVPLPLL
jgi:hypothetical protein